MYLDSEFVRISDTEISDKNLNTLLHSVATVIPVGSEDHRDESHTESYLNPATPMWYKYYILAWASVHNNLSHQWL